MILATILVENGHSVRIFDFRFDSRMDVIRFSPDMIGLSAYTGNMMIASQIAKKIKDLISDIPIIIGGPHVTNAPKETLIRYKEFDFGFIGEGENFIKTISNNYDKELDVSNLAGVVYRNNESNINVNSLGKPVDLNKIPFPEWNLVHKQVWLDEYSERFKIMTPSLGVFTSRGCPFNCTFCSPKYLGKFRVRKISRTIDEILNNMKKYKVNFMNIIDSTLNFSKKHTRNFCNALIEAGINDEISWTCSSRVDRIDRSLLILMKRSGCEKIFFGIESPNEVVLRGMNKNITRNQIIKAIKLCKELEIKTSGNLILGFPFQNKAIMEETLTFIKNLGVSVYVNFLQLFPGAPVNEMVDEGVGGSRVIVSFEQRGIDSETVETEVNDLTANDLRIWRKKLYDTNFNLKK